MGRISNIVTAALLATLICGCAGDRVHSSAELAAAQELAQTYDVGYIEMVDANAESQQTKVIWVHPPHDTVRFDFSLPIKIPVKQKPLKPESADTND